MRTRCGSAYLIAYLILCTAVSGCGPQTRQAQEVTVVFRYDDYSTTSPTKTEGRLIASFQRHHVPCTFAVVPFVCAEDPLDPRPQGLLPLDSVKAEMLKKAAAGGVVEVALHGYSHQMARTDSDERSEFSGLPYEEQARKLAEGKAYLEKLLGFRLHVFVPPFNSYDLRTLRAVEQLGFRILSARPDVETAEGSRLRFIPRTCNVDHVRAAVTAGRAGGTSQPLIVVVLHPYDLVEVDRKRGRISHDELEELLTWITSQPDVRVQSMGEVADLIPKLDAHRLGRYQRYIRFLSRAPLPSDPDSRYVYADPDSLRGFIVKMIGLWAVLYALAFSVCVVVAALAAPRLLGTRRLVLVAKAMLTLALLLVVIPALARGWIGWSRMLLVAALLGGLTGVAMHVSRSRRLGTAAAGQDARG